MQHLFDPLRRMKTRIPSQERHESDSSNRLLVGARESWHPQKGSVTTTGLMRASLRPYSPSLTIIISQAKGSVAAAVTRNSRYTIDYTPFLYAKAWWAQNIIATNMGALFEIDIYGYLYSLIDIHPISSICS